MRVFFQFYHNPMLGSCALCVIDQHFFVSIKRIPLQILCGPWVSHFLDCSHYSLWSMAKLRIPSIFGLCVWWELWLVVVWGVFTFQHLRLLKLTFSKLKFIFKKECPAVRWGSLWILSYRHYLKYTLLGPVFWRIMGKGWPRVVRNWKNGLGQ